MPPRRDPVPRARSAFHWLTGILMLGVIAAGVVAAGVRLWQDIDIQRLTRTPALADPLSIPAAAPAKPAGFVKDSFLVALFYSSRSAGFFPDPQYYPDLADRWERLIADLGTEVTRVYRADQIQALAPDHLVIAPSAVCMTDREVAALRNHTNRGGGLVINWAAGARDSSCTWLGWRTVSQLTGVAEIRELEARDALYYSVPAGIPLSLGFAPGTRVELRFESQLAAAIPGSHVYWSDWAINAAPAEDTEDVNAAALARVTEQGGRIVWFGFRIGQGARPEDEERNLRLFANGVLWAAGQPAAEIDIWPNAARSALLVTQDVESRFSNTVALADIALRKNAPVTFFVVSQLAADHPAIADSLRRTGEVGSQTSDHSVVADLPYSEQRSRLSRSWAEIRDWTGVSPAGLHPPEERFDENTLRAWRDLGGRYLVAVNDSRTASPEIFETPQGRIVLLPRIIKDDYNVFVQESALRSRHLAEAYLDGMAKVRAVGGLAVVSLRTQVAGEPGRIAVIGEVIDSARAQGEWWMATGTQVAEWWLARNETEFTLERLPDGSLELRISAPTSQLPVTAWLNVVLPGDPGDWFPEWNGLPLSYSETNWGLRVPVPDSPAGEAAIITLRRSLTQQ
ncbi:MAG: polysaccharide deacetylase family protein [Gemmatimonadota bacterium]|nr:MAG: polysaccharide deacetylase family protein [Gemmatimonadota bacterium]